MVTITGVNMTKLFNVMNKRLSRSAEKPIRKAVEISTLKPWPLPMGDGRQVDR